MTPADLRTAVLSALTQIAPEADPAAIAGAAPLRDQLELDSMDFLRFVVLLHERLGVDVPEADYAQLGTLDACVAYLTQKLGAR